MAPKQIISKPVSASLVSTAAKKKRSNGDSYGTNRADTKRRKGDDGSRIAPDNSSDKSLQGAKRPMAMDENNIQNTRLASPRHQQSQQINDHQQSDGYDEWLESLFDPSMAASSSSDEPSAVDNNIMVSPSTSRQKMTMCLACKVYQAECTILNDQLLPQSPAHFCLKCADLWPMATGSFKLDLILEKPAASTMRFTAQHFKQLDEIVKDWAAANKAVIKIKSVEDVNWDVVHQMTQDQNLLIAKFDADRLRREWHHHLETDETKREASKNWDQRENKGLQKILESQFADSQQTAIDWDQVAVKVCQLVYRNKKRVRTGFDCFSRHQSSKFNQQHRRNEDGRGKNYFWSIEEEEKLRKLVKQHLEESRRRIPNWEVVRQRFPGTTTTQLATKWRRMGLRKPNEIQLPCERKINDS